MSTRNSANKFLTVNYPFKYEKIKCLFALQINTSPKPVSSLASS